MSSDDKNPIAEYKPNVYEKCEPLRKEYIKCVDSRFSLKFSSNEICKFEYKEYFTCLNINKLSEIQDELKKINYALEKK